MLETPSVYTLVAGTGDGSTDLNAFDHALLSAGVGNVNLLRVSSILPPGALFMESLSVPPGSLLPIAYGAIISNVKDEQIAASVAVGITAAAHYGVIMEFAGKCSQKEAETRVVVMVEEAFALRSLALKEIKVKSVSHTVKSYGCAFAAVPLWYREVV